MYVHGVREVWESYVIYCFLQYLIVYVGNNRLELARSLMRKSPKVGN